MKFNTANILSLFTLISMGSALNYSLPENECLKDLLSFNLGGNVSFDLKKCRNANGLSTQTQLLALYISKPYELSYLFTVTKENKENLSQAALEKLKLYLNETKSFFAKQNTKSAAKNDPQTAARYYGEMARLENILKDLPEYDMAKALATLICSSNPKNMSTLSPLKANEHAKDILEAYFDVRAYDPVQRSRFSQAFHFVSDPAPKHKDQNSSSLSRKKAIIRH